jgi:hypothetical protein
MSVSAGCQHVLSIRAEYGGSLGCYLESLFNNVATVLIAALRVYSALIVLRHLFLWNYHCQLQLCHDATVLLAACTSQLFLRCCLLMLLKSLSNQPSGNNITEAQKFGPATNCDSTCNNPAVNPVGSCGGGLANSLYRLPPQPEGGVSPPPPPPAGGGGAPAPPPGVPAPVIPVPTTTLNVTALGELSKGMMGKTCSNSMTCSQWRAYPTHVPQRSKKNLLPA